jgi:hypothetical protein
VLLGDRPSQLSTAKLLCKDETRRIANIAKLPELLSRHRTWGVALVLLAAGTVVAFKLTDRPAQAASAGPMDPALLHLFLQRGQDEMAVP